MYLLTQFAISALENQMQKQSGAAEACWAHNPEVDGSKPSSARTSYCQLPGVDTLPLLCSLLEGFHGFTWRAQEISLGVAQWKDYNWYSSVSEHPSFLEGSLLLLSAPDIFTFKESCSPEGETSFWSLSSMKPFVLANIATKCFYTKGWKYCLCYSALENFHLSGSTDNCWLRSFNSVRQSKVTVPCSCLAAVFGSVAEWSKVLDLPWTFWYCSLWNKRISLHFKYS